MSRLYKLADLRPHPELDRLLPPQSPDEYEAMKADIAASRIYQPVMICRDGDGYVVIDGRHRLRAADELGHSEVPCVLLDGLGDDERVERGLLLNNRRNLSPEQKRELAVALLKRWPDKPNTHIARMCGYSDKTVAVIRQELVATSEIPKLTRALGEDGKERPTTYKPRTGSIVGDKREPKPKPANNGGKPSGSRIRLADGETVEQLARRGLAMETEGRSAQEVAEALGVHSQTYAAITRIVKIADDADTLPAADGRQINTVAYR